MTQAALQATLIPALMAAPGTPTPARFALLVADPAERPVLAARLLTDLAPLAPEVQPLSELDRRVLVLQLPGQVFGTSGAAFQAAYALRDAYKLSGVEPDLQTDLFPEADPPTGRYRQEGFGNFPPWCWAPEEPELRDDPLWALRALRVPEAWALSQQLGRPAAGKGVIVAQPDTGLAVHAEMAGLDRLPGYDFVNGDTDSTDPLDYGANQGHGTGTASVVAAPGHLHLSGSAPAARLMPIRAIQSVVRVSQVTVAEAIDFAVANAAQVITMSLGGLPSLSLARALRRAVAADVVVLAAAGNCVGEVVFPARYGDCIAVAGTDWKDRPWRGTSRGEAVTVAAPGENVFRARATPGGPGVEYGQGQGTSFAVALVAGVAALWLAHHGRANLVAAARANGETLQAMFRRLLCATARRPADWDSFGMGAGIVDALALLQADVRLGRVRTESLAATDPVHAEVAPVRSLALSRFGEDGDPPGLDWGRYGQELSLLAFRGRLPARPASVWIPEAPEALPTLSPGLRAALALTPLGARFAPPAPAAPHPPAPDSPVQEPGPVPRLIRESVAATDLYAGLLAGARSGTQSGTLRTESADTTLERHPDDVMGGVEDVLRRMPPEEVPDPAAFRRAWDILRREGGSALDRYVPGKALSRRDRIALEAIICVDRSRPSLLLRDGRANPEHPMAGSWADTIRVSSDVVRERALAVGAVDSTDPMKNRPYYGTAWVVDAGRGLAVTNLHVLLDLRAELPHLFLPGATPNQFRVRPGVVVDFSRESNRPDRPVFHVVEAEASGIEGPGFARLDLATLRLEPTEAGQDIPAAIPVRADFNVPQGRTSFCAIGFPGPPDRLPTTEGVNWGEVIGILFGGIFGVKRLAPGKARDSIVMLQGDTRKWVFGHDATTLGGSSGSVLLDWNGGAAAVGLHFAGSTLETNVAHALAQCTDRLRALGIPVLED